MPPRDFTSYPTLAPVENLTRREILRGALALPLLAAGVSCGDDDDDSAAARAPEGRFPVTVEHALGTTTVKAKPERVVALIDRDADTLLALGVTPVAIHSRYGFERGVGAWAEDELGSAKPTVWKGPEFDFEAIAAARPDLIAYTTSDGDQEVFDILSRIAPTLPLPKGATPWGASTEQTTLTIARALGREDDGERVLADLEAFYKQQAAAHPTFAGKTVNYLDMYPGGISSYGSDHIVNGVMYRVGFAPIEPARRIAASGVSSSEVSPERLAEYDADILLVYSFGRTVAELTAEVPTFATLASVKAGRAFLLEDLAFSNSSVLSIPYALEHLLPKVAQALG